MSRAGSLGDSMSWRRDGTTLKRLRTARGVVPAVPRLALFLTAVALLVVGVSMGSNSQEERFLGDLEDEDFGSQPTTTGNLIPFTALLAATGAAAAMALLSRRSPRPRTLHALEFLAGAWLLLVLMQTALLNYDALVEERYARMSVSTFFVDASGAAAVLVPVFALLVAAILLVGHAARHLLGAPSAEPGKGDAVAGRPDADAGPHPPPRPSWRGHLAWTWLASPFLLVVAFSALRLMVDVPLDSQAYGLTLVILPLVAVAALTEFTVLQLRTWRLAEHRDDPRMLPVVREAWRGLRNVEAVALVLLAVATLAGSFLTREVIDATALGRVLILSVRSYVQATAFVFLALLPAWLHARRVQAWLETDPQPRPLARRDQDVGMALGVATATFVLTALTVFLSPNALLPWVAAAAPLAVHGGFVRARVAMAPIQLLAATALWGRGNTLEAIHDPGALTLLDFATHPGVQALWRIAALAMLAWVTSRLALAASRGVRASAAVPLALTVALCTAIVAWLQLSFNAWIVPGQPVDAVGIGSLIRSLPTGVRVFLHLLSAALAGAGGVALARLVRPDWFARRGRPSDEPAPGPTPS